MGRVDAARQEARVAVRTELTQSELAEVAARWGLGAIEDARGLPQGSINTLYALRTTNGAYVLRLSEGRREDEVTFETDLLRHLTSHHYPCVHLERTTDGAVVGLVRDRFAVVMRRAAGEHVPARRWTPEQAWEAGRELGRLHVLGEDFAGQLVNRYAPSRVAGWVDALVDEARRAGRDADPDLWDALPLFESERAALADLPAANEGVIHGDWFPDNLLFVGERLSTVLDFEMACRGPLVLDLAIALHACCYDDDFVRIRAHALVDGYQSERRLDPYERATLHPWARFSALRFMTTRVMDFHRSGLDESRLVQKDWRRFRDRLRLTIELGPGGFLDLCGLPTAHVPNLD